MTTQKTLGQIAYEADARHLMWLGPWAELPPHLQVTYERIAQAVADAVRLKMQEEQ